ncbi:hypothetical protein CLCR_00064 [Cladophialophora carrionii]|uniref:NTF2-like domain-containing protein n=1 Tax=Cladophialophora carrionii TaxID=86049 RepID=A0A1C1CBJ8_9EURO|nr:hypothetical protein CLCR_00064 [Cladophialophora carrionii]
MRSFAIAAAAATLVSSTYAAPWGSGGLWGRKPDPTKCLTKDAATALAEGFQGLIVAYTDANADALLADNLVDFSNSIKSLQGFPVDPFTPVFPTKEAFKQGQGAQPSVPLEILAIDAFNCQNVTLRWDANFGNGNLVAGITHLTASNSQGKPDTWQISAIYTEFDSLAWFKAIGGTVTPPGQ